MKTIATMVVALLLIPSFSYAATPEEQYQSLVNQLIELLTEQVHELQAQLALLQEQKVDKPVSQPVLGATIIAPKPMLKVNGTATKNADTVEVSGILSTDAEVSAHLMESTLDTSGQTPKYTDPVDKGSISLEKNGNSFNFSFPAKTATVMRTAQIDVTYEGKSDYVIATEGQHFNLSINP